MGTSGLSFPAVLFLLPLSMQEPAVRTVPSPDIVRAAVAARLADGRVPGMAVGRISGKDVLRITEGRRTAGKPDPVTASTVFEIGSITKAFTGILLADMVLKGEVALDDPVTRHLPPGTKVPEVNGATITLRHLTTHTSGLPGLPDNMEPADGGDPYADYTAERLSAFLARHQLRRAPGASYQYSNLGAGLLGWALATRAGLSYGELLRRRILEPLGMRQTGIVETEPMRSNLAAGHDPMGVPTPAWHLDVLAGAGAIRSTLDDMLRFAAAARDTVHGPLAGAMALSQREFFRVDSVTSIGLGWHRRSRGGRTVAWHNGGTGGFRSMLVVDAGTGEAGVLLSNSAHGSDALGMMLLDAAVPIPPLPPVKATVSVDVATLRRYPGRYVLTPAFVITITARDTTGIDLQATGQSKFRLYASSPVDFFLTGVEASITFETDTAGKVVALLLHQNGAHQRGPREQ